MRASVSDQLTLLDLQRLDSELDRLAHRRRTLPSLSALAEAQQRITELGRQAVDHETAVADLARAQRKLELDVEQVRARSDRDQQRLDAGSVSTAKELENLQSEIGSLRRRQDALEDELLELMEQRESAEGQLERVRADGQLAERDRAAAEQERDRETAQIDLDSARIAQERAAVAERLPADLLKLYERLRADNAGVGAAALIRRRCEGCHLELSGLELGEVRDAPAEEVVRCEQCGRILVRTAESGLG